MKKAFPASLCLTLCLTFCLTARLNAQSVTGPHEVLAGDLAVLKAEDGRPEAGGIPLETPASGLRPETLSWVVIPDELAEGKYHIADDGKTLVFASRIPGTYHFILAAGTPDGNVMQVRHTLENKPLDPPGPDIDPDREIDPAPAPPPAPAPLPDPDYAAIAKFAGEKAKELVKSQFFDAEKKSVGEAFLMTAKQIEEGKITDAEAARTSLRKYGTAYLAAARGKMETWTEWNDVMAAKLAGYAISDVKEIGKCYKTVGTVLAGNVMNRRRNGTTRNGSQ
ncbi:MAG: hypothetical protein LBQ54_00970 [Planctomycetaceae bacterium]|nr:hypothetical protein [Planctomycetaceae bacterium]